VGDGFVEVISTSGDPRLGGDDFDAVIVDWLVEQFALKDKEGAKTLLNNPMRGSRLFDAADAAKLTLSTEQAVNISLPFLLGSEGLECTLTRRRFESLSKQLLSRLLKPLREVALMSGINLPGESGLIGIDEDMYTEGNEDEEEEEGESQGADVSGGRSSSIRPTSASTSTSTSTGAKDSATAAVPLMSLSIAQMRKQQLEGRRMAKIEKKVKGSTTKELRRLQKQMMDSTIASFPGGQVRYR
jgi:hypothetical protein